MNTTDVINWKSFKDTLVANPELELQFQYAENKWVDASYHITEIKQAPITSVDCGGVMNSWTEIIVQLYEPAGKDELRAMKVNKALSIINLVEKSLPLNPLGIVKIEFGNTEFDTRQMLPNNLIIDGDSLIVDLRPDSVQCKAIDRGGNCGTPAAKPVTQLKNLVTAAASCEPGGGCC
ncbi:DUF6428 family protein [Mucilaginibacter sp.]|uniref:DUF6428 family protein n=1 Tax=Mucilaginibacter sp. TaxID=1882438 RepID=UPI002609BB57|nr:DUF6428 family protein [Mucilaginibacter sp.]MDB5030508.1 hypothetical protein [Mucilaginibacter sp.]